MPQFLVVERNDVLIESLEDGADFWLWNVGHDAYQKLVATNVLFGIVRQIVKRRLAELGRRSRIQYEAAFEILQASANPLLPVDNVVVLASIRPTMSCM